MLDITKYQKKRMFLRKNVIETYDNLVMKMESPSYQGEFYVMQYSEIINFPLDIPVFKDYLFSIEILLGG